MKFLLPLTILLAAVLVSGCASTAPGAKTSAPPKTISKPIITLDSTLSGKVASYNSVGRFVVLSFPVGSMPKVDQTLFLYRNGLKVAELKVTGPQNDNNTVADLVSGDAQVGDDVSDR